jgi:hypothetical protein
MSMPRIALIGATLILALGAAALAVVQFTSQPARLDEVAGGSPVDAQGPALGLDGSTGPLAPLVPLPAVTPSPFATPEQQAWEQVRPLTKPSAPLVRAVAPLLARCFDEDVQVRHGLEPHSSIADARGTGPGSAILMLQMEAADGGLRVVDAPVAKLGNAGDGLVACAQQSLRGRVLPLSQSQYRPGDRVAMAYPLRPATRPESPAPTARPEARPFQRQRGKKGTQPAP